MELTDMNATRSSGPHPSEVSALAAWSARLLNVAKSSTRSPRITAGFSGIDFACCARKSRSIQPSYVGFAVGDADVFGVEHSSLAPSPKVEATGAVLPVITTRYR